MLKGEGVIKSRGLIDDWSIFLPWQFWTMIPKMVHAKDGDNQTSSSKASGVFRHIETQKPSRLYIIDCTIYLISQKLSLTAANMSCTFQRAYQDKYPGG